MVLALFLLIILKSFELVSGLKINYNKRKFGCLGKSEDWCREAASSLNCSQMDIPLSYLGIPVGVSSKNRSVWQPIISKCEAKLTKWKQRNLSMGGRITLINSVLTALPIYLLSFFKIPKLVCLHLRTCFSKNLSFLLKGLNLCEQWLLIKVKMLGSVMVLFHVRFNL